MNHELTDSQQVLLDDLLERFDFQPVVVRITATMRERSIIDASVGIRALLSRTGLVEFDAIGRGSEHKIIHRLPLVLDGRVEQRSTSFYRPESKDDPRFWIERLSSATVAGDALLWAFTASDVVCILLRGDSQALCNAVETLLPSRFEGRAAMELAVRTVRGLLDEVGEVWVQTGRAGPTGVGYTFETLLGLAANANRSSDLEGLELKAYRRGAAGGRGKPVSLFAKTPKWVAATGPLDLLTRFGYDDEKRGRRALYSSVGVGLNALGWDLRVVPDHGQVEVRKHGEVVAKYDLAVLEQRLAEKHPSTLYIRAETRGKGKSEEFQYNEAILYAQPSLANFLELIADGLVVLDFRMHSPREGKVRCHGYEWRIYESAIPRLYAYRRVISGPSTSASPSDAQ